MQNIQDVSSSPTSIVVKGFSRLSQEQKEFRIPIVFNKSKNGTLPIDYLDQTIKLYHSLGFTVEFNFNDK